MDVIQPISQPADGYIIYEQPLNERIRTFLRLEFIFHQIDNALSGESEQHVRQTISHLLDILSIFERGDLKLEIIKEVERLIATLSALEDSPGVDKQMLDTLLADLDIVIDSLHSSQSAIGADLRDNDFIYSIRQRSSIPGGACSFDLPSYHFWLQHTSDAVRHQQLSDWVSTFTHIRSAISTTLRLIRESTHYASLTATAGFYQHGLDSSQPNQLIRIRLPQHSAYYPEVSAGKHRFTVHFMEFDLNQRARQTSEDISFSLSCCAM